MTLETSWSCSSPPSPPWRCCRQRRRRWPWTGSRSSSCSGRGARHTCSATALRWDHRQDHHWGGEEEQGENIKQDNQEAENLNHLLLAGLAPGKPAGARDWPEDELNMFMMRMNSYNIMNWWIWTWGTHRKNSPITHAHLGPHRRPVLQWQAAHKPQLRGQKNQIRPFSYFLSRQFIVRLLATNVHICLWHLTIFVHICALKLFFKNMAKISKY